MINRSRDVLYAGLPPPSPLSQPGKKFLKGKIKKEENCKRKEKIKSYGKITGENKKYNMYEVCPDDFRKIAI